jgi:hypothetical protein
MLLENLHVAGTLLYISLSVLGMHYRAKSTAFDIGACLSAAVYCIARACGAHAASFVQYLIDPCFVVDFVVFALSVKRLFDVRNAAPKSQADLHI